MSYVVQPDRYAQSLAKIRAAAEAAGRPFDGFTAAHLPFVTLGRDHEAARATWVRILSRRYNQDFGPLAQRYGIIGTPAQVFEQLSAFVEAGCRYFAISVIADARAAARAARDSSPPTCSRASEECVSRVRVEPEERPGSPGARRALRGAWGAPGAPHVS